MYKSILQFGETGIERIENAGADFFENPADINSLVKAIQTEVLKLGAGIIGELFDEMDQMIRQSGKRKEKWEIVRRDERKLLTSIGEIEFGKTLYKNKRSGERKYLIDDVLEIEKNARMTEDAEAALYAEAVQTSYRRAGESVCLTDQVSKATVKNKLHELEFPEDPKSFQEKKKVRYLYIDADEDHVPLQFLEKKGDVQRGVSGSKNNTAIAKLVYVYEGIEREAPKSQRFRLIEPYYFSGVYEGEGNKELWDRVYEYIDAKYDLDSVEKIYLNADGGTWIKSGKSRIAGIISVLDEHHINKYLVSMTSHLYDSADDGRDLLRKVIRSGTKEDFRYTVNTILGYAEEEKTEKRIKESARFILSNWTAAKIRLRKSNGVVGSSTEGHVSHVLASRMSSRPMGWSKKGVDKMAQLRAYWWNKGNMLALVRYQKKQLKKVSGAEELLTIAEIEKWERMHSKTNGKYFDWVQCSPAAQARKKLAIREHINI